MRGMIGCKREEEALSMHMDKLFVEFEFNGKPEAVPTSVNGMPLPEDYLSFMREHDGGEGPIGENGYGCFYRLEELEEVNAEYEVQNWWPGHVVLGSDMGDMLWAFNPQHGTYCQIDSCNIDEDTFFTISDSLEEFLIKMDEELE